MPNSIAHNRYSTATRARLTAVVAVPSTEPDTSTVDDFWSDESPRHSFIAYRPRPEIASSVASGQKALDAVAAAKQLAYDVWESPRAVLVLVDLPGVDSEHVALSLGSGALYLNVSTPKGDETRPGLATGCYETRVDVPANVDPDAIDASLSHGLLRIRIAKTDGVSRRLPIVSADSQG